MSTSALSLLQPDELCIVVLESGSRYEARWDLNTRRFFFADAQGVIKSAGADEVDEWMPASVKF